MFHVCFTFFPSMMVQQGEYAFIGSYFAAKSGLSSGRSCYRIVVLLVFDCLRATRTSRLLLLSPCNTDRQRIYIRIYLKEQQQQRFHSSSSSPELIAASTIVMLCSCYLWHQVFGLFLVFELEKKANYTTYSQNIRHMPFIYYIQ